MESKLTLYDILGYLVPGVVVLWAASVLLAALPAGPALQLQGTAGTVLLFFMGYFLGHLTQAVGKRFESQVLIKRWDGFHSVKFLRTEDTHYSQEYKARLKEKMENVFGLKPPMVKGLSDTDKKKALDKYYSEIFNLCYSYVDDKNLSQKPAILIAAYGLLRGLIVASIISEIAFALLTLWGIIQYQFGYFGRANGWQIVVSALLVVAFDVSRRLFFDRAEQRSKNFADAVYRAFFTNANQIYQGEKNE